MSSIIKLNEEGCQNCYKCIRHCPIKAISFQNGRVQIIEDQCVLCGTCVEVCPQNARFTKDHRPKVLELLAGSEPVYATIAPSYKGFFEDMTFEQISAALKAVGFAGVEETAVGAYETSRSYEQHLLEGKMENIITTACPSVVMMIERHYPALTSQLAPSYSPMMAHAKMMKQKYGQNIHVVFIGPCLAKKAEAQDPLAGGDVDYALSFQALRALIENVPHDVIDEQALGTLHTESRLYPKPSGILKTIEPASYGRYKKVCVDGIENCMELFDWMEKERPTGLFVEANMCAGACMGGPVMRSEKKSSFKGRMFIDDARKPRDERPAPSASCEILHDRVYRSAPKALPLPTEEQIRAILSQIGKNDPSQELNCGGCGYDTCRQKAIAVFQGKADVNMCLPFLREKAENTSAAVLQHSPNGTIALSADMEILDINPAAEAMLGMERSQAVGEVMPEFYGDDTFDTARESGKPAMKRGVQFAGDLTVEETVVHIPESQMYVVFLKDMTEDYKNKERLEEMRMQTVDTAQKVIDKQMRVAQEIASLLGETTAETKVALTSLKKSMEREDL
ncbi:4Fe-4S binding protein [Neobittarella massiliensis]|uniref:4Fe-4S binding protein n=1 Tax=Neobittarella massiliensis (ex Bilen et al. 2018) TaxID=2041842 RepID=A0A8J6IQH4_9FIRM|nr:[Fe-Fe] hydrogenase large subunit C-terminal domain-containing protein [Neobittarella massiliensis]MBC3516233.1 4Fe-4S binding protein [Neobittarella massiliensis]